MSVIRAAIKSRIEETCGLGLGKDYLTNEMGRKRSTWPPRVRLVVEDMIEKNELVESGNVLTVKAKPAPEDG